MLHRSIEVRNTFGDGSLRHRGGGGDGAGTHHCSAGVTIRGYPSLLSGSPEQWGVPRERRDRLPCQRVYQSGEQPTVLLWDPQSQTKSGTRCGVHPAGSCLLLRPRPCTARPWYYRTVGERVARSRAACVPRLRHTL